MFRGISVAVSFCLFCLFLLFCFVCCFLLFDLLFYKKGFSCCWPQRRSSSAVDRMHQRHQLQHQRRFARSALRQVQTSWAHFPFVALRSVFKKRCVFAAKARIQRACLFWWCWHCHCSLLLHSALSRRAQRSQHHPVIFVFVVVFCLFYFVFAGGNLGMLTVRLLATGNSLLPPRTPLPPSR